MVNRILVIHVILILTKVAHLSNEKCVGQHDLNDKDKIDTWIMNQGESLMLYRKVVNFPVEAGQCPRMHESGNGIALVPCKGDNTSCPEHDYCVYEWSKYSGCYPKDIEPGKVNLSYGTSETSGNISKALFGGVIACIVIVAFLSNAVTWYCARRYYGSSAMLKLKDQEANVSYDDQHANHREEQQKLDEKVEDPIIADDQVMKEKNLMLEARDKLLVGGSHHESGDPIPLRPTNEQPQDTVGLRNRIDQ